MIDINRMQATSLKLIAIFILIANIAWPVFSYAEDPSDSDHQIFQELDENQQISFDDDSDCDHCCHLSIHLLGMLMNNQIYITDLSNQIIGFLRNNYPTGFSSPPYHPPTV